MAYSLVLPNEYFAFFSTHCQYILRTNYTVGIDESHQPTDVIQWKKTSVIRFQKPHLMLFCRTKKIVGMETLHTACKSWYQSASITACVYLDSDGPKQRPLPFYCFPDCHGKTADLTTTEEPALLTLTMPSLCRFSIRTGAQFPFPSNHTWGSWLFQTSTCDK